MKSIPVQHFIGFQLVLSCDNLHYNLTEDIYYNSLGWGIESNASVVKIGEARFGIATALQHSLRLSLNTKDGMTT